MLGTEIINNFSASLKAMSNNSGLLKSPWRISTLDELIYDGILDGLRTTTAIWLADTRRSRSFKT
jgi:hypothetical protein